MLLASHSLVRRLEELKEGFDFHLHMLTKVVILSLTQDRLYWVRVQVFSRIILFRS